MEYTIVEVTANRPALSAAVATLLHQEGIQRDGNLDCTCAILEESQPGREFRAMPDEEFIRRNRSAGGCADLLAICWLLWFMESETAAMVPERSLETEK